MSRPSHPQVLKKKILTFFFFFFATRVPVLLTVLFLPRMCEDFAEVGACPVRLVLLA